MIKTLLIQALLRQLLDKNTIARIEGIIRVVASFDMPGQEKKEYVLRELSAIGTDASNWVLSMAVDMLVGKMKIQAGEPIRNPR